MNDSAPATSSGTFNGREAALYDAIIIGAGAAGLMCALSAGRRQRKVLLLDHNDKAGAKILISGGGRCNFTNSNATPEYFQSANPDFCKTALEAFPPARFIEMVRAHKIPYHEKKLGQLFCDRSARDIVDMLLAGCQEASVRTRFGTSVRRVQKTAAQLFEVETSHGTFCAPSLVIATGGYSIPKLMATGFGFEIAKQFGLKVLETAPALDGFIFSDPKSKAFCQLAGLSIDCVMSCNQKSFREHLLFTHLGMSGPAALQCSLFWRPGDAISLNLLPECDFFKRAKLKQQSHPMRQLKSILSEVLPARFAELFLLPFAPWATRQIMEVPDAVLEDLSYELHHWTLKPSSTVGYAKAEVTRGGVDTLQLNRRTMEALSIPGLFFIGEVVDVTGCLGGYNFQWAWASGHAAGLAV